jgi:hypothetical protein
MKILLEALKRKRVAFALSVVAIAGLSMSPLMSGVSLAGIEAGKDLLAMLGARSPGERPDGALLDTKLRKAAAALPQQYAMPKTRERISPALPFMLDTPYLPMGARTVPLSQISSVSAPSIYSPGVPFVSGPNPVPGTPIYNPAPGPGPRPNPPPGPGPAPGPGLNPPSAPVPEPTVWMNLIIGFGAIGTILRACRRKLNAAQRHLAATLSLKS